VHGWCILRLTPGERPVWVDHGDKASTAHVLRLATDLPSHHAIAIETPQGFIHEKKRTAAILSAGVEAGRMLGILGERGHRVYSLAPELWRSIVVGKATANDAQVKRAVAQRLALPRQTNQHARDAAGAALGLALAEGWLVNGRGRLPASAPRASAP
jgi:Holliday junction resolvasome RuvABC endonuclease subunit